MLIGCLSAMLSFGTYNGNRRGFTVYAVKNNLGILVVVFTAPGMNPLLFYTPFLTETVSSFVFFPALKKSLFFASLQTALNALSLSFSFF